MYFATTSDLTKVQSISNGVANRRQARWTMEASVEYERNRTTTPKPEVIKQLPDSSLLSLCSHFSPLMPDTGTLILRMRITYHYAGAAVQQA